MSCPGKNMGTFRCRIFLALLSAATLLAQPEDRYPVDWKKVGPEALARFTELLSIDTSNPPGNETRAATYLKQILALDPDRANLVARLKGSGGQATASGDGSHRRGGCSEGKVVLRPVHSDAQGWIYLRARRRG